MGAYFSLHEANEWHRVVNGMPAPSIWSHAAFSPLTRDNRVLLERRTAPSRPRVEHASPYPHGLKIGEDIIVFSEASLVSMLICFEEKAGRMYSSLLLQAPEDKPHVYRRAVEEVILRAPGSKETSLMQSSVDSLGSPTSTRASRTFGRSSPLTTHNPLAATGRRLIDQSSQSMSVMEEESFYIHGQAYSIEHIEELVSKLPCTDAIERIQGCTHEWAEEPKTVGALAGCQLAILAASESENPGVKDVIFQAGAIPALAELLRSSQQDRLQVAVVALGLLADQSPEIACAAREAGVVGLLARLWKKSAVPGLKAAVAMAMENITMGIPQSKHVTWHAPHVHVGSDIHTNPQAGYDSLVAWLSNIGLHSKGLEFQKGRQSLSKTSSLEMQKLIAERPRRVSEFTHLLLYNVKEGILVHFANDRDSCQEAAREIALAYGIVPRPLGRTTTQGTYQDVGAGTAAAASLAAAMRVKCAEIQVGRALPGTLSYNLTSIIQLDLSRHFTVKCEAEEQNENTNCVIFCQRAITELRLCVRGYDIKRACEEREDLGPKVGHAAAAAWEQLWGRTPANKHAGLADQPVDSRTLSHSMSAPALRKKVKFVSWQLESLPDYTKYRVQDTSQPVGVGSRWKQLHTSHGGTKEMYSTFCASRRF